MVKKKKIISSKIPFVGIPASQIKNINVQGINQNFLNWIINNGKLITKSNLDVTSTTALYTIPPGKKFYLIYAFCSVRSAGTNTGSGGIYVNDIDQNILVWDITDIKTYNSQSIAFTIPIILPENQVIYNSALGAGNRIYSGILGYEIDQSLVPSFT